MPKKTPAPMRIVNMQAENIKKLLAVDITPEGSLVQITGKNGAGKQQPVSEPVLTPDGWVPIGQLEIGDKVIGSDGFPTLIEGVFPQSERATFLVKMADGGITRCGPEHLWSVSFWRSNQNGSQRITETLSTQEIIERGVKTNKGKSRRFSINPVAPVQFSDSGMELPVDPYTLGVILGDGHIEPTGYVTVTSWDEEILDSLNASGWRSEHEVGTALWSRPLKHLGLAGKLAPEKFIPRCYFKACVADRMSLLCGLLDTDGSAPDSWAEFYSSSDRLAKDVEELGRSVGFVCKKKSLGRKKYRYKGELKKGLEAWGVLIKSQEAPFRLARKFNKWSPSKQRGTLLRHIDEIKQIDDEDSVCIKVAADDGLYVTNDFILTHNTSVLDAIWWAFTGASNIQEKPIRKGEDKALVRLDLGELIITRKFARREDDSFTTSISVENADGAQFRSPQTMLDELIGTLSLDPLEFARMRPRDQFDALRKFVPDIDFEGDKLEHAEMYNERREKNKIQKDSAAAANSIHLPEDCPTERIDTDALTDELATAADKNDSVNQRTNRRETATRRIQELSDIVDDIENDKAESIARFDQKIAAQNSEAAALKKQLKEAPKLPPLIDVTELRERIEKANASNRLCDRIDERARHVDSATDARKSSEALTEKMEKWQSNRDAKLAKAKLPVEALTFIDDEVYLGGVPFDQASDAEQLQASVAMAMAANPTLRVIRVRDGSLLDEDAIKAIEKMADKAGYQIWIERVDSSGKVGFVIEDGSLKGAGKPAKQEKEKK